MALSPQEFDKLRMQLAAKKSPDTTAIKPLAPKEKEPSFLTRISEDLKKRGENVYAQSEREQSPVSDVLQFVGQGAGFAGDIAGEALKTVGDKTGITEKVIKPVGTAILNTSIGKKGLEALQGGMESYTAFKERNPEVAGDLEAVLNIGALLPIGKGGQIAGKGALKVAETTAEGALKTGKVLSESAGGIGGTLKATGEGLYKSAITPTTKEAERILAYEAKAPFLERASSAITGKPIMKDGKEVVEPITRATTALEKGIAGTERSIGVKARRESQKLWNEKIAPALKSSKEVVTKEDLFAPIEKRIAETVEPTRKQGLIDAYDAIKEDYKDVVNFDLQTAQNVKSSLDEFTPSKVFKGKDVANEYTMLKADMADAIRQKIYNSLEDVNIKKDYLDYANLKELEKIGVKAITEAGTKGGFGSFWSSMYDAVTTPIKTIGGKVLYKVGDKLQFKGRKGINTFGEYLEESGFNRPGGASPLIKLNQKLSDDIQIGMTAKDVTKKIHPEDAKVMTRFIDSVRMKGIEAPELTDSQFDSVEILAQKFGISMDKGLKRVANDFEKILDGRKKVVGTAVPGSIKKKS